MFSRSGGHKTKETYPTRPGSPSPCKQGLNQQSNDKQNCSRNCACYRVLRNKNLNYFIVMFSHWYKGEIILLVLFYTLWDTFKYFIHDLFSWGSQVTNLEQSVIKAFLAGGTYTIINQPSLALTVFLLNTCRQTPKLSLDDLTAIKNKNAWIIFL